MNERSGKRWGSILDPIYSTQYDMAGEPERCTYTCVWPAYKLYGSGEVFLLQLFDTHSIYNSYIWITLDRRHHEEWIGHVQISIDDCRFDCSLLLVSEDRLKIDGGSDGYGNIWHWISIFDATIHFKQSKVPKMLRRAWAMIPEKHFHLLHVSICFSESWIAAAVDDIRTWEEPLPGLLCENGRQVAVVSKPTAQVCSDIYIFIPTVHIHFQRACLTACLIDLTPLPRSSEEKEHETPPLEAVPSGPP